MPQTRRVAVEIPENLLLKVDAIVRREKGNRSDLVREALSKLVAEREREWSRTKMRLGYERMGTINLKLAEEGLSGEDEDLARYEAYLAGDK
jgi:CopG family transcriptional regulator/antitoxin EndoAI